MIEPAAGALYRRATDRFVRLANEYISRVAVDAADLDADDLPPELGFRTRRQFYFTSLMHVAAGSPLTWFIDRCAPGSIRRTHVVRAAMTYLAHLVESNSHRVEDNLKDRARESRRWLEGQIRRRLTGALRSAERATVTAAEKQHLSETGIQDSLARVKALRNELAALTR